MLRAHELPVVGTWYWDVEHSLQFEIVATDEVDGGIEIQYFEGELEELDIDTWYSMRVVSISAPKDWSGPFELDKEDYSDLKDDQAQHPASDWTNPLDSVE